MLRNFLVLPLIAILSSGCAFMFPYEKEFACKRGTNMGKCIDSMKAYEESTSGEQRHEFAQPASKQKNKSNKERSSESLKPSPNSGFQQYKDSEYRQISKVLDKPITPILKKPQVLQILVLPYQTQNGTQLNGNRFVHVIMEDSAFVLGDVMTKKIDKVEGLFGN